MIGQKETSNRGGMHGSDLDIIKLSREHNDANVLSIGAGFVSEDEAKKAVETWLITPFSNEEKHRRRIGQMDNIA
jgi:ribose 5-phosphate isomerase B